jgi:hypothetical protein
VNGSADADPQTAGDSMMGGPVLYDTNVLISYAHNDSGMSTVVPWIARWLDVVLDVRQAVQELRQRPKSRSTAEHCLAAFRRLQALPDEVWDTIEPLIHEEIAVLYDLCASDKDLH